MYQISNIDLCKKIDFCVWNVVFRMDDNPLQFTTDFLYLIKEKKWVFNSLITHELISVTQGHTCIYCGQEKIACFVASSENKLIKVGIIKNEFFRNEVSREINLPLNDIPIDYVIVNELIEWKRLAEENRFYGNIIRIQSKNEQ
ncbi:hypothetical protein RJD24_16265 [Bacillaceae bacterium IKA-2]|jgi:hypothetical protein|nr:hypothetical protein RJD24_16265 [Bacillaceae bacterium IKA-2]